MKKPNYPLYDILKKEAQQYLHVDKKILRNVFIETLQKMEQDEFDIIFILIKINANLSEKNSLIPYDGIKKETNDVVFNFNKFPIMLQRILYSFAIKFNNIKVV